MVGSTLLFLNVLRILPPANPPQSRRTLCWSVTGAKNGCSAAGYPEGKPAALSGRGFVLPDAKEQVHEKTDLELVTWPVIKDGETY